MHLTNVAKHVKCAFMLLLYCKVPTLQIYWTNSQFLKQTYISFSRSNLKMAISRFTLKSPLTFKITTFRGVMFPMHLQDSLGI